MSILVPADAMEFLLERARALGAEQADALYAEDESLSVDLYEGTVRNLERSDSTGLGIRVFVQGKPGYSFTERLTRDAVERCAQDAIDLAQLTETLELDLPASVDLPDLDLDTWSDAVSLLSPETMAEFCRRAEVAAKAADSRVENVPHLGCSRGVSRLLLANSNGLRASRRGASVSLGIGAVAKAGGVSKMGWDGLSLRNPAAFCPEEMAIEAAHRAVALLDAKPIPSGNLPVVFDERVAGGLLGIFLGSFSADSVQTGQSRWAGRVGEQVAPPFLQLATDPHRAGMAGSRLFDGEGIVTKPRYLLQNGVLQGFLHNLETAQRAGVPSTGDATRGYTGRVGCGFSNVVLGTGSHSMQQLLESHPRLLHVVKLEGSSGCSSISGDISIGVQGFLIENGKMVHPVDRVTLSGNFFELLMTIEALGNRYRPGVHSSFVPAFLVRSMEVASSVEA